MIYRKHRNLIKDKEVKGMIKPNEARDIGELNVVW